MSQIKARAAFDMQCKEDQVEVIEISSFRSQYGARGCGKQASYIVRQGQAILNSPIAPIEQSTGAATPPPAPPAPPAK